MGTRYFLIQLFFAALKNAKAIIQQDTRKQQYDAKEMLKKWCFNPQRGKPARSKLIRSVEFEFECVEFECVEFECVEFECGVPCAIFRLLL
jgi:hypothetical protein